MATNDNNFCTCTTPEYTIILNQQGPSGRQGEAGQNGFSPIVAVGTNTRDTYTLTITTADGVITTPNLKSEPIPSGGSEGQVLTNFGNNVYSWGNLPNATTENNGVVFLSTDEDFQPDEEGNVDDTTACTPQSVVDYVNTLDLKPLENIKDITNGVQIMGFEEVPSSGIYKLNYFQFIVDNTTNDIKAQRVYKDYEDGALAGTRYYNFLTDYSVTATTGITVSRENNGVTIGSTTGNLKYSTLTSAEYSALTPDADTMYRLTDTNEVYLGTIKLTGGSSVQQSTFVNYPESSVAEMNALKSDTQITAGYPDTMKIVIKDSTVTARNINILYPGSSLPNANSTGYTQSSSYNYNINLSRGTATGTTLATALLYYYDGYVYYTDSLENLISYVSGFDASKAIYIGSGYVADGDLQQLISVPEYVINNFVGG